MSFLLLPEKLHVNLSRHEAIPVPDALVEKWSGRVVTYRAGYGTVPVAATGALQVQHCSAEPVFDLLCRLGVTHIVSYGVGIGEGRDARWADEPLGLSSYTRSAEVLLDICRRHSVVWEAR